MHQLRPPQRIYMSKKHGYALALPPSWHKAICGNSDPPAGRPVVDNHRRCGALVRTQ